MAVFNRDYVTHWKHSMALETRSAKYNGVRGKLGKRDNIDWSRLLDESRYEVYIRGFDGGRTFRDIFITRYDDVDSDECVPSCR